jgi:hypothetical protein
MAFWQLLYQVMHIVGQCRVVTESTHSTPATENAVVYGGSCLQSLLYVLSSPLHNLAFEIGFVS